MSVKVHILWTNHYRIYFWCQNFWNSFLAQYFLEHALKLYFLAEIARNVYTSCQDINLATLFHFPNLWTLRVAAPLTSCWSLMIFSHQHDRFVSFFPNKIYTFIDPWCLHGFEKNDDLKYMKLIHWKYILIYCFLLASTMWILQVLK